MKWYNRLLPTDNHMGYSSLIIFLIAGILIFLNTIFSYSTLKIAGLCIILHGGLSLYAAFFTNNTNTFTMFVPFNNQQTWSRSTKKLVNVLGGIMWIFVGLIMLRTP